MKRKWYLEPWFIAILFALWWIYGIPAIVGIILLVLRRKQDKQNFEIYQKKEEELQNMISLNEQLGFKRYEDITNEVERIRTNFKLERDNLEKEISSLTKNRDLEKEKLLEETKRERQEILSTIDRERQEFVKAKSRRDKELTELNEIISKNNESIEELDKRIQKLKTSELKIEKQITSQKNKLLKIKELYKSIDYCITNFMEFEPQAELIKLPEIKENEYDDLAPSVILQLHSLDVKELRKAFRQNDKQINTVLEQYSGRYTTKANIAIYNLMVIALRSELQNILYNLKYEKLDDCINQVKTVTSKYLKIAGNGNQSIVGTLTKFIGEIEYLFINAVKIEYNYYVKREQAKQEQKALREQMRQEAAERKALAEEKKKIEKEESKYNIEIEKLNNQLATANESVK